MSLNLAIKLTMSNNSVTLSQVVNTVESTGCIIGDIDLISSSASYSIRELVATLRNDKLVEELVNALTEIPGVQVNSVVDRVLMKHVGGKIEVSPKYPVQRQDDLSVIYTPGVAGVSKVIAGDPDLAYSFTMKNNTVAIVTDGTAVLGLGNIGPEAALPVMEGKSVLFKKFAGIDAIPVCLNVHEPQQIIDVVAAIAPAFGGINLEDISAPRCFEIEAKLSEILDIPVFHDDQHGTAIVVLAGLINALKVVNKRITDVKLVICGAGAAGVAITKILLDAGARHIVVCDRDGALARDNLQQASSMRWVAEHTNEQCVHGSVKDVIEGADVFIGVSGPGVLNRDDVTKMAEHPVVFALANPDPEIVPEEIYDIAAVIATGRSDYPNQINNALVFPGIFRGALDCHAKEINEQMYLAAANTLANLIPVDQLNKENIIPSLFNQDVVSVMAKAIIGEAKSTGVVKNIAAQRCGGIVVKYGN
jgi:malate dehydrogenase (oxaloacetate-decarboxylating)